MSSWVNAQALAVRNSQLLFDDVHTGNHFRNGVFDLQARIHLNEIELVILVQEFKCTRALIAQCPDTRGRNAYRYSAVVRPFIPGAGASSITFLMSALHRTVPFAQVHGIARGLSRKDLYFNMARSLEKLFHVYDVIAKGSACALGLRDRGLPRSMTPPRARPAFRVHRRHPMPLMMMG